MPEDPTAALEQELRLHDRALGASSCGITIADATQPDMPLIYINDAFERLTGYDRGAVLGRNCRFLQGDDRDQPQVDEIRDALRAGRDCKVVLRNYRKDGTLFWNELFMSPVYDSGALTHYVGVQTIVTDRVQYQDQLLQKQRHLEQTLNELRQAQAMLVHSEKMTALGQMVAGVAHEINNPVAFVNSNLYSLRGTIDDIVKSYNDLEALVKTGGTETLIKDASAIRREADLDFLVEDLGDLLDSSLNGLRRVKSIVEALRTFSRLDEAELKFASLHDNIQSTLLMARGELRTVQVITDLSDLPEIKCYPAELNQVFLNLIINAAQAMHAGESSGGTLTITGRDQGTYIELQFSDTGSGIAPEHLNRVFEPFFTTKPVGVGTGLGLSIAYKLITDRHQGQITVNSTLGVGTTFTLKLPKNLS
ncbi:MAG: PAS domain-containing protein [Chloroflexi bacterium]|nr:PAS domain-containing protein [Chloroflexota bacterium]